MRFVIIDKDHHDSILAASKILDVAKHGKATLYFFEHEGEDLIIVKPAAGRDSFLIGNSDQDKVSGLVSAYNLHERHREEIRYLASEGLA